MEAVLKIGGGLSLNPDALRRLCLKLAILASTYKLAVVPGGAVFADEVRLCHRVFHLSEEAAHRMAILAMSMYGLLIADMMPGSKPVYTVEECLTVSCEGALPVILPHRILEREDPFPASWNVTSDSISAYIARLLGVRMLVLVKDVDGIYDESGRLLETVSLSWLRRHPSCLDRYFPEAAKELEASCYVVNGLNPERVEALLKGEKTVCTEILLSSGLG